MKMISSLWRVGQRAAQNRGAYVKGNQKSSTARYGLRTDVWTVRLCSQTLLNMKANRQNKVRGVWNKRQHEKGHKMHVTMWQETRAMGHDFSMHEKTDTMTFIFYSLFTNGRKCGYLQGSSGQHHLQNPHWGSDYGLSPLSLTSGSIISSPENPQPNLNSFVSSF